MARSRSRSRSREREEETPARHAEETTDAPTAPPAGAEAAAESSAVSDDAPAVSAAAPAAPPAPAAPLAPVVPEPAPISAYAPPVMQISNEELSSQLQQRAQAKSMRNFAQADDIRNYLTTRGVNIQDRTRSWTTTDGRSGNTIGPDFFTSAAVAGGATSVSGAMQPVPGGGMSGEGGPASNEWIADLLKQRENARMNRDYGQADALREQLRARGVTVDDRTKSWSTTDGRSGSRPNADGTFSPAPGMAGMGQMGGMNMGMGGMNAMGMGGMGGMNQSAMAQQQAAMAQWQMQQMGGMGGAPWGGQGFGM